MILDWVKTLGEVPPWWIVMAAAGIVIIWALHSPRVSQMERRWRERRDARLRDKNDPESDW